MSEQNKVLKWVVTILSVAYAAFHLYTAAYGTFIAQLQRPLHLAFAVVIGFLVYPASKGKKIGWFDMLWPVIAFALGYLVINYEPISLRQTWCAMSTQMWW